MSTRTALTALAAGLALAAPASAARPDKQDTEVVPYSFSVPCDGFDILVEGVETINRTFFYNRSGDLVKVVTHANFRETDTNSVTGETVRFTGLKRDMDDLRDGTRTVTGLIQMNIPGEGNVIHDVGRVVFAGPFNVIFEAGRHDVLNGNIDALSCAALA